MSIAWILAALIGIGVGLFTIIQVVRRPLVVFSYLLRNALVGTVGLLVVDYLGKSIALHVPLNLTSAGVVSVLGLPGVAALAILQKWVL